MRHSIHQTRTVICQRISRLRTKRYWFKMGLIRILSVGLSNLRDQVWNYQSDLSEEELLGSVTDRKLPISWNILRMTSPGCSWYQHGSRIINKTKSDPNVPNDKMMKLIQCLTIYKTVWILLTHSDLDQDEIFFSHRILLFQTQDKEQCDC